MTKPRETVSSIIQGIVLRFPKPLFVMQNISETGKGPKKSSWKNRRIKKNLVITRNVPFLNSANG